MVGFFDILLMTANHPWANAVIDRKYPTAEQIAMAWLQDSKSNVNCLPNNRHYLITTFQDDEILRLLHARTAATNDGASESLKPPLRLDSLSVPMPRSRKRQSGPSVSMRSYS